MFEQVIKSVIGYIIPAVIGFLVAWVINYRKKNDSLKNGVKILLQSNLTTTYFYYEPFKKIPDYVYRNFLNQLGAYEGLEGDDYIHTIAEHMKNWEITRTDILKDE